MPCSAKSCFMTVSRFFQDRFRKLGTFIGKYPIPLIIISFVVTAGLGVGLITLSEEKSTETLYTPMNSRASQERPYYQATFPDASATNYRGYALTDFNPYATVIVNAADGNVFSNASMEEVRTHIEKIKNINATYGGVTFTYNDICARQNGSCYISGEFLTSDAVFSQYSAGSVTYPDWLNFDLSSYLGLVGTAGGKLVSAKFISISFPLRSDSATNEDRSQAWEEAFLQTIPTLTASVTTLHYEASHSLDTELDKNTSGDITIFAITFTLMITYATIVAGGDVVSSRTWASWAGVMAAGFGIVTAFGLVSVCGLKFVNIVGVMPFLIIGIGVDDMFLLMSSWAETYPHSELSLPDRMGMTFAGAGIGITITSLTDLLAFVIGASSVFVSVRNFCVYTGVAVIFTYLYQCFLFGPCLAIHGRRVDDNRHCMTCLKTRSRDDFKKEGGSCFEIYCCGGSRPTDRSQDERFFESIPRKYLPKLLLNVYGKVTVIVLFLAYLGVSIWGTVNFKQGLVLKNLVSTSSYFHSYSDISDRYFPNVFPVPFVFGQSTDYTDVNTVNNINNLFTAAKADIGIDANSEICWLASYRQSGVYDNSSNTAFITGLKTFLTSASEFENDVIFDETNTSIRASRCYFFSTNIKDSQAQADVMLRMRSLTDNSPLSVYVYHPSFIFFEQYVSILPSTLQTIGVALGVMTVVTFIFLPHPLLVLLVVICIVSILVGIFGFLHIWGLTLSTVTMIHLIMSVGFSVDFSVHVCSAYMLGEGKNRHEKTEAAIVHAAGPILNGGMSSFLGIIVLVFSQSYIFNSFFKIMFTVILFGMLHAVFLLPVILSILGPVVQTGSSSRSVSPSRPSPRPPSPPIDYM